MGDPIVHVELISSRAEELQSFYRELFGWQFHDGFVPADSAGLNGNIDGGAESQRLTLYVGVDDVEAALVRAERAGAERIAGPEGTPGELVVGRFRDPSGFILGVAGEQ